MLFNTFFLEVNASRKYQVAANIKEQDNARLAMININMLTVTAFQEYMYNKIVNLLGLIKQEHALFQDVKMPMILDALCVKEGSVFYLMDLVKKEP